MLLQSQCSFSKSYIHVSFFTICKYSEVILQQFLLSPIHKTLAVLSAATVSQLFNPFCEFAGGKRRDSEDEFRQARLVSQDQMGETGGLEDSSEQKSYLDAPRWPQEMLCLPTQLHLGTCRKTPEISYVLHQTQAIQL